MRTNVLPFEIYGLHVPGLPQIPLAYRVANTQHTKYTWMIMSNIPERSVEFTYFTKYSPGVQGTTTKKNALNLHFLMSL